MASVQVLWWVGHGSWIPSLESGRHESVNVWMYGFRINCCTWSPHNHSLLPSTLTPHSPRLTSLLIAYSPGGAGVGAGFGVGFGAGVGGVGAGSRIFPDMHWSPVLLTYDPRMKHCLILVFMFQEIQRLSLRHRAQQAPTSLQREGKRVEKGGGEGGVSGGRYGGGGGC
jgi:hypothetical protein